MVPLVGFCRAIPFALNNNRFGSRVECKDAECHCLEKKFDLAEGREFSVQLRLNPRVRLNKTLDSRYL